MSIWEQLFTSLIRVFIEFITIVLVVSAMLFLYNVNTVNNYISQCNAIVARSGGLTQSAYTKCEMYSREYYHNYFHASANGDTSYENTKNGGSSNYIPSEQAFGQPTTYYVYSRVPFMRSLPNLPKLYYGTHDKPSDSGHQDYHSNNNYGSFQRKDMTRSANSEYDNAANHKPVNNSDSGLAAPIEEDVHSMIRAGSQN